MHGVWISSSGSATNTEHSTTTKSGDEGQRQESILIQAYNGGYRCGVKRAARYDGVDMRGYADVCGIGRRGIQEGLVDEGKCPARFLVVGMARRS